MTPCSPNGIENWLQTHFFMVQHFVLTADKDMSLANRYVHANGYNSLIPLAVVFANEFEEQHKGRQWKGDYFYKLDQFIESKEKQ